MPVIRPESSRSIAARSLQRLSLQELMVDFFGSLVPGVIFLSASALLVGAALTYYFDNIDRQFFVGTFPQVVAPFELEVLIAFLMLAYVIGFLFFRQDPKEPDRRSFRQIRKSMQRSLITYDRAIRFLDAEPLPEDWTLRELFVHWRNRVARRLFRLRDAAKTRLRLSRVKAVTREELIDERNLKDDLRNWVVEDEARCEFPYPNLRRYLEQRQLDHLASMVAWHDEETTGVAAETAEPAGRKSSDRRSKNAINVLKIRLAYHFPEHSGQIVRNEAHVRLMSSTWYMSRTLLTLSTIVLLFNGGRLLYRWSGDRAPLAEVFNRDLHFLLVPFAVALIALWVQRTVERFLHYQRVREVIFVLETAFTAFRGHPERIQDICPGFLPTGPAAGAPPGLPGGT